MPPRASKEPKAVPAAPRAKAGEPMALDAYRRKRNFAATAEPRGGKPLEASDIFVVQKHDATRLHYDFRLAVDGAIAQTPERVHDALAKFARPIEPSAG